MSREKKVEHEQEKKEKEKQVKVYRRAGTRKEGGRELRYLHGVLKALEVPLGVGEERVDYVLDALTLAKLLEREGAEDGEQDRLRGVCVPRGSVPVSEVLQAGGELEEEDEDEDEVEIEDDDEKEERLQVMFG